MIQSSPIEVLDADSRSRREFDPDFLHAGFHRRVWISSDPGLVWKRSPCRTLCPLTLVPIFLGGTRMSLRFLDGDGQVRSIAAEAGNYYLIPPNTVYQIETQGMGVLEIYAPVSADPRSLQEQLLPPDYLERREAAASELR